MSLYLNPAENMEINLQIESKEDAKRTASTHCEEIFNKAVIFTDASKIGKEGNTGIAAVSRIDGTFTTLVSKTFPPEISVYRGEMEAVACALETEMADTKEELWIFTDSASTLHAIANWKQESSPIIRRVLHQINTLTIQGKSVHLRWCPSHCGIDGNEAADQAAKEAANIAQYDHLEPNFDFFKRKGQHAHNKNWQYYWERATTGRFTFSILPRAVNSILENTTDNYGRDSKLLFRLLLGHIPTNDFGRHMNRIVCLFILENLFSRNSTLSSS